MRSMSFQVLQYLGRRRAWQRIARRLALVGAAALPLAGCIDSIASLNCKRVSSDELRVGKDQSCRFSYAHGDVAKYVVVVTRQPTFGEARGEGKYLRYIAKPGFVGMDTVGIKIERRGVGHVQWENRTLRVRVGPTA
jgi:hypothetical protein